MVVAELAAVVVWLRAGWFLEPGQLYPLNLGETGPPGVAPVAAVESSLEEMKETDHQGSGHGEGNVVSGAEEAGAGVGGPRERPGSRKKKKRRKGDAGVEGAGGPGRGLVVVGDEGGLARKRKKVREVGAAGGVQGVAGAGAAPGRGVGGAGKARQDSGSLGLAQAGREEVRLKKKKKVKKVLIDAGHGR